MTGGTDLHFSSSMHSLYFFAVSLGIAAAVPLQMRDASLITLATFDGAKGTSFKWSEMNDPVMGVKPRPARCFASWIDASREFCNDVRRGSLRVHSTWRTAQAFSTGPAKLSPS